MEFYRAKNEIGTDDIMAFPESDIVSEGSKDILATYLLERPGQICLAMIKPLSIHRYREVLEILKANGLSLLYSEKTILSSSMVNKLYADMRNDELFFPTMTKFLTRKESILIFLNGDYTDPQAVANKLKGYRTDGKSVDGVIRAKLRGAKYNGNVYQNWVRGSFDENTRELLARNYVLKNGIHMPDTQHEAEEVAKCFLVEKGFIF